MQISKQPGKMKNCCDTDKWTWPVFVEGVKNAKVAGEEDERSENRTVSLPLWYSHLRSLTNSADSLPKIISYIFISQNIH
jgi:hypothetical protein